MRKLWVTTFRQSRDHALSNKYPKVTFLAIQTTIDVVKRNEFSGLPQPINIQKF